MNLLDRNESVVEKSDDEILSLSIERPDLFSIIVDRYQAAFLRKIGTILRTKEEAEDIVQDTFVKIYIHAAKFKLQEGASFKSWAYKILLNTCFTYCKKMNRQKEFMKFADNETMDLMNAGNTDFEKKLDTDYFLSVASKIPNALSYMLKLVAIEGKNYEDLAEAEGISLNAVRTRLHRAKKEFKKASVSLE
jgi:RNA polymerase sigma factor (sigma-70 family)